MGKALDLMDTGGRETHQEMVLQTALGYSLMYTEGPSSRARTALMRASELAESFDDFNSQLRAYVSLSIFCMRLEEFRDALVFARRSEAIAGDISDPVAVARAQSNLSSSLLSLGDYAEALTYARRVQRGSTPAIRGTQTVRFGIDPWIQAQTTAAHVLCQQGLLDQSAQTTRYVLADAHAGDRPLSLCFALMWCGCMVPLERGDLQTAELSIAQLKDHAERHALRGYYASGLAFEGQLAAKRGDTAAAERLLRTSLDELRQTRYEVQYTKFRSGLAEVLAAAGEIDDSLAAADEALRRAEHADAFWWLPEALRIKGEILLLLDKADTAAAEDHLRRSIELAHRQGALFWELRTAVSIARLQRDQNRIGEARQLLASVYGHFTEGFETTDLQSAKRLLDELA
jgi:tetratricopeptide (TPR) repeat protein